MAVSSQKQNLWDAALDQRKKVMASAEKVPGDLSTISNESHLLVCGSKDSGKTSLIQRFLERDEPTKPTVALEFCYGRKSKQNNMTAIKDTTQIWELGGGATMAKLIDVVVTPANIRNISIVLVLDLSQPHQLWETQNKLLTQIKQRINKVITEAVKTDPNIEKDLKEKAWNRVGLNHEDKNMITPFLIPLVIIGAKFDVYQELSSDEKQMISKTIRFISHSYGGMVQFFSTKAEGLSGRAKALLSHLAFNTSLSKTASLDHMKPVIAPYGHDSLQQIGAPPISTDRLMRARGGSPFDLWKEAFGSLFPPQSEVKSDKHDPTHDEKFTDELVDNIRIQKDQELDRYRKLSERKAKEAQLNASVGIKPSKAKTKGIV